ncbi:MAG TPA: pentapeptide repeat-containing protein [Lacisediminihabitans sp.]|uniref:pentapeptide repeat-containing protein n=1 Tax=Lacisediminihabitans sp. TaxID=2787631 RepID=UPI002ED9B5D6
MPSPAPSIRPPRLGFSAPVVVDADATALVARDDHDGERFADTDLSGYDLTGSEFVECELADLTLTDTQLRGSRFVESLVVAPFAPTLLAARTTWRDVSIENPRWGSAELFEAQLNSVHLRGGKIDYLNLRASRLTDVLIEDCTITDLDLGGFHGTRVALRNCRIGTLDLTRATCVDVDLRTSDFSIVNGIDGLRGAAINEFQLSLFAPVLAAHLGIVVE